MSDRVSDKQHNLFFQCLFAAMEKCEGKAGAFEAWNNAFINNWECLSGQALTNYLLQEAESLNASGQALEADSAAERYAAAVLKAKEQERKDNEFPEEMLLPDEPEAPTYNPEDMAIFDDDSTY